jgi:hypothetical protein
VVRSAQIAGLSRSSIVEVRHIRHLKERFGR